MGERINKYMSSCGFCSRREADRLIADNRVYIDGELATVGSRVSDGQVVTVDGRAIVKAAEDVLLAVNKPVGVVCTTTDKQGGVNIVDLIGYPERVYPVGRLDKDSEGLILMTNNGQLMDDILRSANGHEKEYIVTVNKRITEDFIKALARPIYIKELDRTTKPCKVTRVDDNTFKIILTQGLNRQIRRMTKSLGYTVVKLKRIRILNIHLDDLRTGEYRKIEGSEYKKLLEQVYGR